MPWEYPKSATWEVQIRHLGGMTLTENLQESPWEYPESVTWGLQLRNLGGNEFEGKPIGIAIGIIRIGNFGGTITVSGKGKFEGKSKGIAMGMLRISNLGMQLQYLGR